MVDGGWLLQESQLRVRLGSHMSAPAVHLYPSVTEDVVLSVNAALQTIHGPPMDVPLHPLVSRPCICGILVG